MPKTSPRASASEADRGRRRSGAAALPPPILAELEIGVDEAGRGPILGPMVLACVALDGAAQESLRALGVTDSKRFGAGPKAHAARAALVQKVHAHARHVAVAVIEVDEIDVRTRRGELNKLEQEVALRLLGDAPAATRIVADGARIFAPLRHHYPHLQAENKAELSSVAVAAASLCAKVRRDELWESICARYRDEFGAHLQGFAGGGYLNDATRRFLRAYCARYRRIPPEGRTSWPWDFVAELLPAESLPAPVGAPLELVLPGLQ
jgi:ribonuclease HII